MFKRIVFSAALAGLIVGFSVSLIHALTVVPMVLQAEQYETADSHDGHGDHHHSGHEHSALQWQPDDGLERFSYTLLTNILASIGFALLLAAFWTLTGNSGGNWKTGLLWGVCGFLAFQLAPSLGLPPELPGMPGGDLESRQLWWVMTVISTIGALFLLLYGKSNVYRAVGVIMFAMPHVIGAPHGAGETAVPVQLWYQFVMATLAVGLLYWVLLGMVTGYLYKRFNSWLSS